MMSIWIPLPMLNLINFGSNMGVGLPGTLMQSLLFCSSSSSSSASSLFSLDTPPPPHSFPTFSSISTAPSTYPKPIRPTRRTFYSLFSPITQPNITNITNRIIIVYPSLSLRISSFLPQYHIPSPQPSHQINIIISISIKSQPIYAFDIALDHFFNGSIKNSFLTNLSPFCNTSTPTLSLLSSWGVMNK